MELEGRRTWPQLLKILRLSNLLRLFSRFRVQGFRVQGAHHEILAPDHITKAGI